MTPTQCRMARAATRLGVRNLARVAELGVDTVHRFERGDDRLRPETIAKMRAALEARGAEFIQAEDGAEGVVFRPPAANADPGS